MLTNDSLRSADGRTEATTRRRLLHMATTVAAIAPRTGFLSVPSLSSTAVRIDDYADAVGKIRTVAAAANHQQPGDPQRLAQVIVQLAAARKPPTRLARGSDTVARIEEKHRDVGRELCGARCPCRRISGASLEADPFHH